MVERNTLTPPALGCAAHNRSGATKMTTQPKESAKETARINEVEHGKIDVFDPSIVKEAIKRGTSSLATIGAKCTYCESHNTQQIGGSLTLCEDCQKPEWLWAYAKERRSDGYLSIYEGNAARCYWTDRSKGAKSKPHLAISVANEIIKRYSTRVEDIKKSDNPEEINMIVRVLADELFDAVSRLQGMFPTRIL